MYKQKAKDPPPIDGYRWHGNDNWQKILGYFVKENPHFAISLTAGEDNGERFLQLQAYDEDDFDNNLGSWYHRLLKLLPGAGHNINVRFNTDWEITRLAVWDEKTKKTFFPPKDKWDYYASGVVYNSLICGSGVHAIMHVYHYILTMGIDWATEQDKSLHTWADPYFDNIALKYMEVSVLLMKPHKVGGLLKMIGAFNKPDEEYILTSSNLYGPTFKNNMKEIFNLWGTLNTAEDWLNKFMFRDLKATNGMDLVKKYGVLKEYRKIVKLIGPYAKDVTDGMKKDNPKAFATAEKRFVQFLKASGDSRLDMPGIRPFIEMMTVSGLFHGSTLSMTRLIARPEFGRWHNIGSKVWTEADKAYFSPTYKTMAGMEVGRHIFTSALPNRKGKKWPVEDIGKNTYAAMKKWDAKAEKVKQQNKKDLLADPEKLREYGWILTDWCPDGFDGKQMTIATYI